MTGPKKGTNVKQTGTSPAGTNVRECGTNVKECSLPDPTKLSGLELRAAVAGELFGRNPGGFSSGIHLWIFNHDGSGEWCPQYESSRDAAQAVLEEIERRGLMIDFVNALEDQFTDNAGHWPLSRWYLWQALKANPEQICRAALLSVREHKEKRNADV